MARARLAWPRHLRSHAAVHRVSLATRVDFRDCDPMGILWHGHYLGYCERARHELGRSIGFAVDDLLAAGIKAPIVRSQVVHLQPLRPEAPVTVEAALYASHQPRLYHRYRLLGPEGLAAEAETEQVLLDREDLLQLTVPPELAAVFAGG